MLKLCQYLYVTHSNSDSKGGFCLFMIMAVSTLGNFYYILCLILLVTF